MYQLTTNTAERIPIRRNVKDANYRYKMVPLEISEVTNYTLFPNIEEVAKDLCTRPDSKIFIICLNFLVIVKYIGLELSVHHEEKKFTLNGHFSHSKLVDTLYK